MGDDNLGIHSGEAGKGDSPRNLGKSFRDNYDLINWEEHPAEPEKPIDPAPNSQD